MTDEHPSGCPVEVSTPALETRVDTLIQEDRQITLELTAEKLQVSVGKIHNQVRTEYQLRAAKSQVP